MIKNLLKIRINWKRPKIDKTVFQKLDHETEKIDLLISKIEKQIWLLNE